MLSCARGTRALLLRSQLTLRAFATENVGPNSDVGVASGVPEELLARKVTIYAPARTASQQGQGKSLGPVARTGVWRLEFETQQKWENPLIGWTSTADPLENVARSALKFDSKEDAITFCQKHGWDFTLVAPKLHQKGRSKRFAGYGDNFSVRRHGYPEGGLISEK